MSETRKLAAILVADVVGYSRLAGTDEDRTLARLRALRSDLIDPTIALHNGRLVKRTGDGSLIEFRSVVGAVRCAIEVQTGVVERNAGLPPELTMPTHTDQPGSGDATFTCVQTPKIVTLLVRRRWPWIAFGRGFGFARRLALPVRAEPLFKHRCNL